MVKSGVRVRKTIRRTQELQRSSTALDQAEVCALLGIFKCVSDSVIPISNYWVRLAVRLIQMKKRRMASMLLRRSRRLREVFLIQTLSMSLTDAPLVSRSNPGLRPLIIDWKGRSTNEFRVRYADLAKLKRLVPPADSVIYLDSVRLPVEPGYRASRETMLLAFLHKMAQGGPCVRRCELLGGCDTKHCHMYKCMVNYIYKTFAYKLEDASDIVRYDLQEVHDQFANYLEGKNFDMAKGNNTSSAFVGVIDGECWDLSHQFRLFYF